MGFEEIPHTADWSVHVWGPDLASLFIESARAMNSLAGVVIEDKPRVKRTFESSSTDSESLLVSFLSELVYYQEQESLAFDKVEVEVKGPAKYRPGVTATRDEAEGAYEKVEVEMEGARIVSADKAIKAVTYHNMKIEETTRGYEVVIVFDV